MNGLIYVWRQIITALSSSVRQTGPAEPHNTFLLPISAHKSLQPTVINQQGPGEQGWGGVPADLPPCNGHLGRKQPGRGGDGPGMC